MKTANLPEKHSRMIVRSTSPYNAGPPLELLCQSSRTPNELFFVRSHGEIPAVDTASYRLAISAGADESSFSISELLEKFSIVREAVTLQCAGNRRSELLDIAPIPGELPWGAEAIGTADWTGIRLADVLASVGADGHGLRDPYIEFTGLDRVERNGQVFPFGGSIPLRLALEGDVLLAFEMNGKPLPPAHGAPLRALVPGNIGARSVKWLSRLTMREGPSPNYFQGKAYRLFPRQVTAETVVWESGLMLGEVNLSAVICLPAQAGSLLAGKTQVVGYAVAGGSRRVARVELSVDGGETWQQAQVGETSPYCWVLWSAEVNLQPGMRQIVVRAVDSAANSQPEDLDQVWNFKGYANNAWHRVVVNVKER